MLLKIFLAPQPRVARDFQICHFRLGLLYEEHIVGPASSLSLTCVSCPRSLLMFHCRTEGQLGVWTLILLLALGRAVIVVQRWKDVMPAESEKGKVGRQIRLELSELG